MNILRIDSSMRSDAKSRALSDRLLAAMGPGHTITTRDLASGVPQIDAAWIEANQILETDRNAEQRAALAYSDKLIAELEAADAIVIGMPVYNFGAPAALKAWIDQVCRAHRTFHYTEDGPKGLLRDKRAVVLYVAGGTALGSDIDFASGHMKHVLGFIGIKHVTFIDAGRHLLDPEVLFRAEATVNALAIQLVAEATA